MAPEKGSELAEWEAEVDDVFVPAVARASFTKAQGGLPTTAAAGSARAASTVGRRMSSLGSLHPHAGHTSWPIATGHLITAIIGAGVLGLPNAVAWLGWIAGMVCVCVFYAITLWTCTMLTDCYHVKGKRHTRYKWAVLHIMGPRHAVLLSLCQHLNMILTTIGYHIAAADSMQ